MNQNLLSHVLEFLRRKMWNKRWQRAVTCLAAVAVFGVTYALIMPAITMTNIHPTLFAETLSAWSGDELTVKVTAEAEEGKGDKTFVLKNEGEGADLSASYVFNEEGVCVITDEEGKEIELHRSILEGKENMVDYWFTLEEGKKTAFTLEMIDEVDTSRFSKVVQAVKQEKEERAREETEAEAETASASNAGKSEAAASAGNRNGAKNSGATASNAAKATMSNADIKEANAAAKDGEEKIVTEKDDDGFEQILDGAVINDMESDDEEEDGEQTEVVAKAKLSIGFGSDYFEAVKDVDRSADKRNNSELKFTWKDVTEITVRNTPLTASVEGAEITLFYDADAGIPADASLSVDEIDEGTDEYNTLLARAQTALDEKENGDASKAVNKARFFDITILNSDGGEVEPLTPVRVVITYEDALQIEEDGGLDVMHFSDETPEILNPGNVEGGTEVEALSFTAESFSIYAVVESGPKTHTFEFYKPTADGTGFELYETVILKSPERLEQPEPPVDPDGATFVGWFTDSAYSAGSRFSDFGAQPDYDDGEPTKLYAKFAPESITIRYHYDDKIVTSEVAEVPGTYTITATHPMFAIQSMTDEVMVNVAWKNADGTVEYGRGVPSVINLTAESEDMDLYAVIEARWLVDYYSEGGTQTESEYVIPGDAATPPEPPERLGYIFGGWYRDPGFTTPHDFDEILTSNIKLYAKWEPTTVKYKVVIWAERPVWTDPADRFGYLTYFEKEETAGAAVSFTEADKDVAENSIRAACETHMPYVYESDDVAQCGPVKGDGSTILDVYYRSKLLNLYLVKSFDPNVLDTDDILNPGEPLVLRYGQSTVPPQDIVNEITQWNFSERVYPTASTYKDCYKLGGYFINRQTGSVSGVTYVSGCKTAEVTDFPDNGDFYICYKPIEENYTEIRETYHETIESSETENGYKDHANYVLNRHNQYPRERVQGDAHNNDDNGFVLDHNMTTGYTKIYAPDEGHPPTTYSFHAYSNADGTYYSFKNPTWSYNGGFHFTGIDESTTPKTDGTECILKMYQRRQKYNLYLDKGDGPDPVNANITGIPYEKNLGLLDVYYFVNNDGHPEAYVKDESTYLKEGVLYKFKGWFEDPTYLSEVDPNGFEMPVNGFAFYAKWEPLQVKVTFDEGEGATWNGWHSGATNKEVLLDYGEMVGRPNDPTKDGQTFLGWTLDGKAYSFTSHVTRDITLVAQYADTVEHKLQYDANGGEGQVPTDNAGYLLGASAIATPGDALSKDGHDFVAWSDTPSGEGNIYYPGDPVPVNGPFVEIGGVKTQTLYARYASEFRKTQLIYDFNPQYNGYNMNFASGETQYVIPNILNNLKFTPNNLAGSWNEANGFEQTTGEPVPKGYRFLGWATASDATSPVGEILVDVESEANNRLYAMWFRYETDINLRKVASSSDAEPAELSGAVFEVLKKNDDGTYTALEDPAYHGLTDTDPVSRITIDGSGTVKKLFDGEYQIKEVKAPDGYIMTGDVISFTITNGVVTDSTQSGMITYNSDEKKFTVGNEPGKPLPHTGGEGTLIYAFGGMMLLMMSALMYGFRKRYER